MNLWVYIIYKLQLLKGVNFYMFKTLLEEVAMNSDTSMAELSILAEEEMDELANTFDELITPEADPVDEVEDDSVIANIANDVVDDAIDSTVDDSVVSDVSVVDDSTGEEIDDSSITAAFDEPDTETEVEVSISSSDDDDGIDLDLDEIDPDDILGDVFGDDDALIMDDHATEVGDVIEDAEDDADDNLDDIVESIMLELENI